MKEYNPKDTISAISSPIGEGAISIVRLSGDKAIDIANKIFSKDITNFKTHTIHYGKILNDNNEVLDSVMLSILKAPNTYTGEDIIEIHCHGSKIITEKILTRTIQEGARIANPGEFTFRAFLNKKLDLAQAEAVQDLISANNDLAIKAAKDQLEGRLSSSILKYQKDLTEIAAILEAWVDFPEEGLEFISKEELLDRLNTIYKDINKLSSSYENGKIFKEGILLGIIGSTNVGKSSLMNALLKKQRAIVTDIAGTTRDIIEEDVKLNNLHYKVIDTAGIRNTNCEIEKEGIKRSKDIFQKADILLIVLDSTKNLLESDYEMINNNFKNSIIVWNKIDLKKPHEKIKNHEYQIEISAKENINIENLISLIEKKAFKGENLSKNEIVLTKKRHKIAIDNAAENLQKVIVNLEKDVSSEFLSFDMKSVLSELAKIIGFDITEDILSSIFKNFCIGK